MKKKPTIRKPVQRYFGNAYIGIDDPDRKSILENCLVYIGGRHYHQTAQIHLDTIREIRGVGEYLLRAADWLESRKK